MTSPVQLCSKCDIISLKWLSNYMNWDSLDNCLVYKHWALSWHTVKAIRSAAVSPFVSHYLLSLPATVSWLPAQADLIRALKSCFKTRSEKINLSVNWSWLFNLCLLLLLSQWSCCGAHGPDDWNLNIYFNCTDLNPSRERCGVPFSCCVKDPAVSHSTIIIHD